MLLSTGARRNRLWLSLALTALAPAAASADQGALTLEIGPCVAFVPSLPAPVSGAEAFSLVAVGALFGVRYALSNHLELGATGLFQAPASVGADLVSPAGVVVGTAEGSVAGFGALLGARYVTGLAWRIHLGGELGFSHLSYSGVQVTGVGASAGDAQPGVGRDSMAAAASVGVEWQWNDHMSVGATPRLQVLLGGVQAVEILLTVTFGYAWYLF